MGQVQAMTSPFFQPSPPFWLVANDNHRLIRRPTHLVDKKSQG